MCPGQLYVIHKQHNGIDFIQKGFFKNMSLIHSFSWSCIVRMLCWQTSRSVRDGLRNPFDRHLHWYPSCSAWCFKLLLWQVELLLFPLTMLSFNSYSRRCRESCCFLNVLIFWHFPRDSLLYYGNDRFMLRTTSDHNRLSQMNRWV